MVPVMNIQIFHYRATVLCLVRTALVLPPPRLLRLWDAAQIFHLNPHNLAAGAGVLVGVRPAGHWQQHTSFVR